MDPHEMISLETGQAGLDDSTRALLAALDKIAPLDDQRFRAAFPDLVCLVERDFRFEEAMMEEIGYPAERSHREQHARVLSGLHHAEADLFNGDASAARRCIELLPKWLELHVTAQDAPLAAAIELARAP